MKMSFCPHSSGELRKYGKSLEKRGEVNFLGYTDGCFDEDVNFQMICDGNMVWVKRNDENIKLWEYYSSKPKIATLPSLRG